MKKVIAFLFSITFVSSFSSCTGESNQTYDELSEEPTSVIEYYSAALDKTFEDDYVRFNYSSEWEEYDTMWNGPAFTIAPNVNIIFYYSTFEDNMIPNDEFIERKQKSFERNNEEYEIVETHSGQRLFSFIISDEEDTKKYLYATGKPLINIEITNYSEEYSEIINEIIDNIKLKDFGSANRSKTTTEPKIEKTTKKSTEKATEKPTEKATKAPKATEPPAPESNISTGQKNALKSAKSYIDLMGFSYQGLIDQLEYEGYSHDEAVYGADNCGADWNAEALESAKSYIRTSPFSYTGLIDQLEYEDFTYEQAVYGADNCGADWLEQAAKSAQSYMNIMSMSRDDLLDQLLYEGFTQEQAEYGVQSVGY